MATATRTLHGTRSILYANLNGGEANDKSVPLGMFESIETGVTQDHFEPFILGRATAGEIALMGQAPIMVRLSGFRKIAKETDELGPYGNENVDMADIAELYADNKELSIQVIDRTTQKTVLLVKNCKVVSHNFSVAAKQPSRMSIELVGLVYQDEAGDQADTGVAY